MIRTLSRWKHLLKVPHTIECPSIQIIGRDFEEPIFSGSGQIDIRSRTQLSFSMHAKPRDGGEAFRRLVKAQKNPYNIHDQFRVIATQYDGTEWHAGWTTLHVGEVLGDIWRLSGPIHSLMTGVSGHFVSPKSSIEVIYDSKLRVPLPLNMSTSIRRGDREILRKSEGGGTTINVADTQIEFFIDPELDATWAVADTSAAFPHPHAENWVSEPLCLLLGQLVFPRLVARNFGDSASIWLRPSPAIKLDTLAASILQQDPLGAHGRFWDVYCRVLTMITQARDDQGHRNFEAHELSRYYHEVIQATRGSNWVWCLTVGSAIEGIAKLLAPSPLASPAHSAESITSLRECIETWDGDPTLRERVSGFLTFVESESPERPQSAAEVLRGLVQDGTIDTAHRSAWKSLRNKVAHGELVSPWSQENLEEHMRLLTELLHRLSMQYIEQHSS